MLKQRNYFVITEKENLKNDQDSLSFGNNQSVEQILQETVQEGLIEMKE